MGVKLQAKKKKKKKKQLTFITFFTSFYNKLILTVILENKRTVIMLSSYLIFIQIRLETIMKY